METGKQASHFERINYIKQYIQLHLDEPLSRKVLAQIAGFSEIHFHRIFLAYVGENIATYIRRVRMERAAQHLLNDSLTVTEIGLASGYETHSAFSKAFKQHFSISPTEFRELNPIAAAHLMNRRIFYNRKDLDMKPLEIRTLPDTKVLYARSTEIMNGPAFETANQEAFNKLMDFLDRHKLMGQMSQCIAIYPDEPEIGKEVRFDAGAIFAAGTEPKNTEDLAYQVLPGGRWAIFRHVGPYDTLWQTWQGAYRDWLSTSGEALRDAIPYEVYIDDPSQVAPEKLRTDIYLPLK